VTVTAVLGLLAASVGVRVLAAALWATVPKVRDVLSTTEVGYLVAGVSCLLWAVSGADPVLATLVALSLALMAGGLGATLRRSG